MTRTYHGRENPGSVTVNFRFLLADVHGLRLQPVEFLPHDKGIRSCISPCVGVGGSLRGRSSNRHLDDTQLSDVALSVSLFPLFWARESFLSPVNYFEGLACGLPLPSVCLACLLLLEARVCGFRSCHRHSVRIVFFLVGYVKVSVLLWTPRALL